MHLVPRFPFPSVDHHCAETRSDALTEGEEEQLGPSRAAGGASAGTTALKHSLVRCTNPEYAGSHLMIR